MLSSSNLTEAEWALIRELLENERRDLPQEIRRTHYNPQAHEDLKQRLKMVEGMLEKARTAPVDRA